MAKGIGAGLKIDSSGNVLTDVSGYLRGIAGGSDVSRLDGTVLQPDVAALLRALGSPPGTSGVHERTGLSLA